MKKKVLITGGTGLLGRNWANIIKDDFDTNISINKRSINLSKIKKHKINFLNKDKLKSFIIKLEPDYVIHTLGQTNIEKCEKFKKNTYNTNVIITKNLSSICGKLNIKLIYISTDHLFDGRRVIYNEKSRVKSINFYAKTKYLAEKYVLRNNTKNLVLRCNFFGNGFNYRKSWC